MSSKKSILLTLMLFFVFIVGLTATCAADITNDDGVQTTSDAIVADTTSISSDIEIEDSAISDKEIKSNTKEIKKENKNTEKTTKKATTHVINNNTIGNYFIKENNYTLADNVVAGDILDIQGNISNLDDKNFSMIINKPVNIITSTKDAYIDLNTTAGSLMGENPGTSFSIVNGANGTNVTGIYFHNTQIWISGVSDVVVDNISAIVENQKVGSGNGQTSIRNNATNITLKNSHISTTNNGGSSSVVLAWANNCLIENNTIEAFGNVGNILYLTSFNIQIPEGATINSNNILRGNRLNGPTPAVGTCYCIGLSGNNNTIDGNIINYSGVGITIQFGTNVVNDTKIINNQLLGGASFNGLKFANTTYANNTFTGAASFGYLNVDGQVYAEKQTFAYSNITNTVLKKGASFTACNINNCTIDAASSLAEGCNMTNCIVKGELSLNDKNNVSYCNLSAVTMSMMNKNNNVITNNNITGLVKAMRSRFNTIANNTINNPTSTMGVQLMASSGNTVTGNTINANGKYGNEAVSGAIASSTVRDNFPIDTTTDVTYIINGNTIVFNANVKSTNSSDSPINSGKVAFEFNGVALGQSDVVNGVATYTYTSSSDIKAGKYQAKATYTDDKYTTSMSEFDVLKAHIINNATIGNYFIKENNYTLSDIVNAGDYLDFQGKIANLDDKNFSIIINKPVNIISSTKDAYIDLNTTAGSLLGENPGTAFSIINGANGTNMSGIYLHNTQFWISTVSDVVIDNISAVVEDQRVGSGVGQTSIRNNATNITLKNSFIYTRNNGGSSSVVIAWADYCTIENNTIQGEGQVGNLFYLTTYNVNLEIPNGTIVNSYNKFINNRIIGPEVGSSICGGIYVCGSNNTIANNIVSVTGAGLATQWGTNLIIENYTIENNTFNRGSTISAASIRNSVFRNNTFTGRVFARNSVLENNTILGSSTITSCNFTNNTVKNSLTIANTSNVTGNSLETLYITSASSKGNVIENNTIVTKNTTKPVTIKSTNNTFANNYVVGITTPGDEALNIVDGNIVANITPVGNVITITEDNYETYFDNDGNIVSEEIRDFTKIILEGTFTYRSFRFEDLQLTVEGVDATLIKGKITLTGATAIIRNITIHTSDVAMEIESNDNLIENMTIDTDSSEAAIAIIGNGTTFTKSTIVLNNEDSAKAITIKGSKNKITNNTVNLDKAVNASIIIVDGDSIGNNITLNTITINNATDAKAIIVNGRFDNGQISSNNIYINATNISAIDTTDDIKASAINSNKIIIGNADTLKAIDIKGNLNNVTVNSNTIETTNTTTVNAIVVEGILTNKAQVSSNNIKISGADSIVAINVTGRIDLTSAVSSNKINITAKHVIGIVVDELRNTTEYKSSASKPELRSNTINITALEESDENAGIIVTGENYVIFMNTVNGNVIPLKVYNSTKVDLDKFYGNITKPIEFINVVDSSCKRSNINTTNAVVLKLTNSSNNNITGNTFFTPLEENYGDNAVVVDSESLNNNITENNPIIPILNIEGIDNLKVDVPSEITITITDADGEQIYYDRYSQNITVIINGQATAVKTTNYTFTFTPNTLENTIEVVFNDKTHEYAPVDKTYTCNASIGTPKIIITGIEDLKIDEPSEITVAVVNENNDTINADDFKFNVVVNGQLVEVNGTSYTFTLTPDVIKNSISANFTDNTGVRENATITQDLNVAKSDVNAAVKVDVQGLDLVVGKTSTVTITIVDENGTQVPKLTDGTFTIIVDGKEYKVDDTTFTFNIKPTSTRKITIDVMYTDNTGRTRNIDESLINNVEKGNVIIDVSANSPKALGDLNIITTVFDDENKAMNTGKVSFKINNVTLTDADGNVIYADVNNGFAKLNYKLSDEYKFGSYNIEAEFVDESYNNATSQSSFIVFRNDLAKIKVDDITIKTHENTTLNMTLKDKNGNVLSGDVKVVIKLNGKTFTTTTVKDGQLNVDLNVDGQQAKIHTVTLKFGQNSLYNSYSTEFNLQIIKRNVNVVVKTPENAKAAQTLPVYVTVTEDGVAVNGGSVTFKVNGKTLKDADGNVVTAEVKDGQAVIMNKLPTHVYAGNASIVAIYKNNGYETANNTTTLNVTKADLGNANINVRTINKGKNATLKATVYDESFTKVASSAKAVVKINGKTFAQSRIVDGKLDVNFDTSSLKAGSTYNVTVIIGENKLYNSKVFEVPLTIKA